MMTSPRFLLSLGLILLIMGWTIPFLIIMYVVPSTLFLNFLSWGLSVAGLFLGFIGAAMLAKVDND